jgi:hypothetical protein
MLSFHCRSSHALGLRCLPMLVVRYTASRSPIARVDVEGNVKMPSWSLHSFLKDALLPAGYPNTVAPTYAKYLLYATSSNVFSSAGYVLGTTAMLDTLGVGTSSSAVVAGASAWILKDGLGMLFSTYVASRFGPMADSNPRRAFLYGQGISATAPWIEATTLLFPATFLLWGSLGTVAKSAGSLLLSSSRVVMHSKLARSSNLGDITSKANAQNMYTYIAGMTLGLHLPSNGLFLLGSLLLCSGSQFILARAAVDVLSLPKPLTPPHWSETILFKTIPSKIMQQKNNNDRSVWLYYPSRGSQRCNVLVCGTGKIEIEEGKDNNDRTSMVVRGMNSEDCNTYLPWIEYYLYRQHSGQPWQVGWQELEAITRIHDAEVTPKDWQEVSSIQELSRRFPMLVMDIDQSHR